MIDGVNFPEQNAIRIRLVTDGLNNVEIDYINRLPQYGLMQLNTQYQAGIYPTEKEFYPDWLIDKEYAFQYQTDTPYDVRVYKPDGTSELLSATDITPAGRVGLDIYKYKYTPAQAGFYYITLEFEVPDPEAPDESILAFGITDIFRVNGTLPEDKNLIELQFYSPENTTDFIFDQYYKAYYTGHFKKAQPQWNVSMFDEDEKNKLASKTYSKVQVTLTEIKDTYYETLCKQLESDIILLNGIPYTCEEPPELEEIPQTDLFNITFELTGKYNNNVVIIS